MSRLVPPRFPAPSGVGKPSSVPPGRGQGGQTPVQKAQEEYLNLQYQKARQTAAEKLITGTAEASRTWSPSEQLDMEWGIVKANNNKQDAEDSVLYNKNLPGQTIFEIMQNKGFNSLDEVINQNKTAIRNRNKGNVLQEGQFVTARPNLDIKRSTDGVTLLSVHDAEKRRLGNVLKNTAAITLENADFTLMHTPQMRVASGEPKSVFSGVTGYLINDHEKDGRVNRNGIVAKFNPFIQHFYMTEDGRAVKSAEEVTVENNKVFLRGRITYYNENEIKKIEALRKRRAEKVTDKDLSPFVQSKVNPTRFTHGGFVDKPLYPR